MVTLNTDKKTWNLTSDTEVDKCLSMRLMTLIENSSAITNDTKGTRKYPHHRK